MGIKKYMPLGILIILASSPETLWSQDCSDAVLESIRALPGTEAANPGVLIEPKDIPQKLQKYLTPGCRVYFLGEGGQGIVYRITTDHSKRTFKVYKPGRLGPNLQEDINTLFFMEDNIQDARTKIASVVPIETDILEVPNIVGRGLDEHLANPNLPDPIRRELLKKYREGIFEFWEILKRKNSVNVFYYNEELEEVPLDPRDILDTDKFDTAKTILFKIKEPGGTIIEAPFSLDAFLYDIDTGNLVYFDAN